MRRKTAIFAGILAAILGLQPAQAGGWKWIAYGDTRTNDAYHRSVEDRVTGFEWFAEATHAALVRTMMRSAPDLLLHTGDFVQEGNNAREWQTFFDIEAGLVRDKCIFASIGNHELYMDDAASAFVRYFGPASADPLYGSMRWGNARFFFWPVSENLSRVMRASRQRACAPA